MFVIQYKKQTEISEEDKLMILLIVVLFLTRLSNNENERNARFH